MADYLYFSDGTAEAVEELDNHQNDARMRKRGAVATYWQWQRTAAGIPMWVVRKPGYSFNRSVEDEALVPESVRMLHLLAEGVNHG